ncbi:MAG TPA: CoA transferase [Chloroflexota bacterium]|nr:CoA transferase [Chloroflexota bacterium]
MATPPPGVLDGVRVIDLAHPYGQYAGKLLADLGADVIKVEPWEGDPGRRVGPFKGDERGPNRSLFWAYYNSNKRGIAAKLTSGEGQDLLRRLLRTADAVIHTPQHAPAPVDLAAARKDNPKLVVAALKGFAEGGPYSGYRSTPQTVFALSGIMKSIGPPDGPPEAAPGQVAMDLAAVDVANGIVCALLSGQGQEVTIVAHEVLAAEINPRAPEQFEDKRYPGSANPQLAPSGAFHTADGQVTFFINLPNHWTGLKELLGHPPELEGDEWNSRDKRGANAKFVLEATGKALAHRQTAEVVSSGQALHVPCGPINTVDRFAADPHAAARGFFVDASNPGLGDFKMPGAPYKMSEAGWALRRSAPRLGEDSREILTELGYSAAEIESYADRELVRLGQAS